MSCNHPGPCRWKQRPDRPSKRCKAQAKWLQKVRKTVPPVDGLEDEFGPCPLPVPDSRWYDWVIVEKVLLNEEPPRYPTPSELKEIGSRTRLSGAELATLLGVVEQSGRRIKQRERVS